MITSPRTWAAIILALLPLSAALAEDASVADLQKRLEEQEQRTRVLERKLEIQDENAQAARTSTMKRRYSRASSSASDPDN